MCSRYVSPWSSCADCFRLCRKSIQPRKFETVRLWRWCVPEQQHHLSEEQTYSHQAFAFRRTIEMSFEIDRCRLAHCRYGFLVDCGDACCPLREPGDPSPRLDVFGL